MIESLVNILKDGKQFNYCVEYLNESQYVESNYEYNFVDENIICFRNSKYENAYKKINRWWKWEGDSPIPAVKHHIGYTDNQKTGRIEFVNESKITLYFPSFSVETYDMTAKYNITISTYIHGVQIILASYIISRKDALASKAKKTYKNNAYVESIELNFIDPWHLCYSDDWKEFREVVCNEPSNLNDTHAIINVEITPVEYNDDSYIIKNGYLGGFTTLFLSNDYNNDIHMDLSFINQPLIEPSFLANIDFNRIYDGDLLTYMKETYHIDLSQYNIKIIFDIDSDGDNENCFVLKGDDQETQYMLSKSSLNELFKSWDDYRPGLNIICCFAVCDDDNNIIYELKSNELPITPDVFKYILPTDKNYINLNLVHMQSYQVDVVNKIQKNIIKVNKPDDYKANILRPIFIQTSPLNDVVFHPQVTENVCINLNAYKLKVNCFYIRIEGMDFVEIGRTSAGVVFNVNGGMLPNKVDSGLFYILDENKELVTTGNYMYRQ